MKLHQDGNRIVVTELNPMSDLIDGRYCCVLMRNGDILPGQRHGIYISFPGSRPHAFVDECKGWLPMPVCEQKDV